MFKVIATKHAIKRLRQRYQLLFHSSYFLTPELTGNLLISLYENGKREYWWEQVPFYLNKVHTTYGPVYSVRCNKLDLTLMCVRKSGIVYIKTVVKNFNPRLPIKGNKS